MQYSRCLHSSRDGYKTRVGVCRHKTDALVKLLSMYGTIYNTTATAVHKEVHMSSMPEASLHSSECSLLKSIMRVHRVLEKYTEVQYG